MSFFNAFLIFQLCIFQLYTNKKVPSPSKIYVANQILCYINIGSTCIFIFICVLHAPIRAYYHRFKGLVVTESFNCCSFGRKVGMWAITENHRAKKHILETLWLWLNSVNLKETKNNLFNLVARQQLCFTLYMDKLHPGVTIWLKIALNHIRTRLTSVTSSFPFVL